MTHPVHMKPAVLPAPLQSLVTDPKLQSSTTHLPALHSLAVQIEHNLQYQHSWTALRIHTHSPLTNELLPRPLVSGVPPERAYIDPDEQIELLKKADQKRKAATDDKSDSKPILEFEAQPEREWVLPTRLSEKWTLHQLHDVFTGISIVPPENETSPTTSTNPWRTSKRAILATVDTDSTVVYYVIHEGMIKPRQN
ncbi:hypothetical protein BU24DRAFT_200786 [Aaosphaeria arxii CBS 175.79]|uniref:tRNA-splicing endonuclease subunit Sen15 domain-containing protein n=1 Tax=Aaosphaeria arxii CBS 175.79 TaxID=1450172 RepID=A0A6A5XVV3_9PLEO|nr:uncharacterized protein BU24DRAFT_200786 [Aaosphaeria arxii CBS 175.79]KAF2016384.1 hypothetical protein BU24DRAFT_200786 [Aaosphaeria arxii CBS 175.79]